MPALVSGLLTVGFLALATRGMHLDGLADTADGLGCFGPPERALAVMRDGGAGPFAVVTLVVVLGAAGRGAGRAGLSRTGRGGAGGAGRRDGPRRFRLAGPPRACPRPDPVGWARRWPVRSPGGSRRGWWVVLAGAGYGLAGPRGVLAVALGAAVVAVLSRHTARRFGGMTGDVLGAASELAVTAALVVLSAGAASPP